MASLYDLPDEIILHICSFIPSREVVVTLPRVSRRLSEMLMHSSEWYWRSRYLKLLDCKGKLAVVMSGRKMWQLGCVQADFTQAIGKERSQVKVFRGRYVLSDIGVI